MLLMSRGTGKNISDEEHLVQSIVDIVTTPLGSRVMRRDYGCGLFELIDHPMTRAFYSKVRARVAEALDKWEPRIIVLRVYIDATRMNAGRMVLGFDGIYLPQQRVIKLRDVEIAWKVTSDVPADAWWLGIAA